MYFELCVSACGQNQFNLQSVRWTISHVSRDGVSTKYSVNRPICTALSH